MAFSRPRLRGAMDGTAHTLTNRPSWGEDPIGSDAGRMLEVDPKAAAVARYQPAAIAARIRAQAGWPSAPDGVLVDER